MHSFKFDGLQNVKPGDCVELERGEASHLFKTLRAASGFVLGLMDGHGFLADARVVDGRKVEIVSVREVPAPSRRVHLFIAPPRRQRMDQILRQCAELGVWSIHPMLCERSVSLPDEDSVAGRWEDVLMDACKQSGNPFLPRTHAPEPFKKALGFVSEAGLKAYFGAVSSAGDPPSLEGRDGDYAWFVGPEGGFSASEEASLLSSGVNPLRIGRCILRVETAAVCGVALLSGCRSL